LARATWKLGDSDQIVSAAACARSLLETAAAFGVDARKLSEAWRAVKADTAENGPKLKHWQDLTVQIWLMMWGAKFDDKVPDLARAYKLLPRTNVLGLIEKLQRATDDTVQRDYQWLSNAAHPSIGGMLAFAAPMMRHDTGTHAFQFVAPLATRIESSRGIIYTEKTIDAAIARSATLAVIVLLETLDVALRIVDDVALTTGAPAMASFTYWRMVSQEARNALCPCRSGRKAKHCRHKWAEEPPRVTDQFRVGIRLRGPQVAVNGPMSGRRVHGLRLWGRRRAHLECAEAGPVRSKPAKLGASIRFPLRPKAGVHHRFLAPRNARLAQAIAVGGDHAGGAGRDEGSTRSLAQGPRIRAKRDGCGSGHGAKGITTAAWLI
jgi:hypothetical protein